MYERAVDPSDPVAVARDSTPDDGGAPRGERLGFVARRTVGEQRRTQVGAPKVEPPVSRPRDAAGVVLRLTERPTRILREDARERVRLSSTLDPEMIGSDGA